MQTGPVADKAIRKLARRSADTTRERILDAALMVFADRSFDGASTREIATRAGVTQPLLNYHFRSKEELWRVSVDVLFENLKGALRERIRGLRGVDELTTTRLLIREFVLFSARHPQLNRIITGECKTEGPRLDWLVEHHVQGLFDSTTHALDRLRVQGLIPDIPPAHLYYILTGGASTMFIISAECRRVSGLDPTSEKVIEDHADAVTRLIFGSGAPSTPFSSGSGTIEQP